MLLRAEVRGEEAYFGMGKTAFSEWQSSILEENATQGTPIYLPWRARDINTFNMTHDPDLDQKNTS